MLPDYEKSYNTANRKYQWNIHTEQNTRRTNTFKVICQNTTIFHKTPNKTRELAWKENQRIQDTGIEDSQGNIIVDHRQVLKIWDNYITELCSRANRPKNLEVETQEEVDSGEKSPYILHSEAQTLSRI